MRDPDESPCLTTRGVAGVYLGVPRMRPGDDRATELKIVADFGLDLEKTFAK